MSRDKILIFRFLNRRYLKTKSFFSLFLKILNLNFARGSPSFLLLLSIRISVITRIKIFWITQILSKPLEKITWDPGSKTFCARTSKNPPNVREAFGSSEDKLKRIKTAAAIVPRLAASSGLEAVVNDSTPCTNNFAGATGSTNFDPATAYPIAIAPYWIPKFIALLWASISNCSGSCIIKLPTSLPADANMIIASALGVIIMLLGMTVI